MAFYIQILVIYYLTIRQFTKCTFVAIVLSECLITKGKHLETNAFLHKLWLPVEGVSGIPCCWEPLALGGWEAVSGVAQR